MPQYTKQARQYIQNEQKNFEQKIKNTAPLILKIINQKRNHYGLNPHKRITLDIIKETIKYLITDNNNGDAQKTEKNNVIEHNFEGGMYT